MILMVSNGLKKGSRAICKNTFKHSGYTYLNIEIFKYKLAAIFQILTPRVFPDLSWNYIEWLRNILMSSNALKKDLRAKSQNAFKHSGYTYLNIENFK